MTNKKISALTATSTPLVGTEVVPLTQSGTTDSSTVANLTAGRDVSVAGINVSAGTGFEGSMTRNATNGLSLRGVSGTSTAVLVPASTYLFTGTVTGKFYSFGAVTISGGTVTSITNLVP